MRRRVLGGSVEVVIPPADEEATGSGANGVTVLYCDACRRWGPVGSAHLCRENWHKRLGDLLRALGSNR